MNDSRSPLCGAGPQTEPRAAERDVVQIVLQPIVDISTGTMVGSEALARFPGVDADHVAETFAIAHAAGRGADLEAACIRAALRRRGEMPGDALLSVNVSPDALANESVQRALKGDLAGVIVEVTEHAAADTPQLLRLIADLRDRGALIAVDDASTGYAGLLRLTKLRPDIVKLDRSLVSGVADNVEQSAVIEALVSLSRRIGARVLGEGVETLDDLIALAYLDVDYAQGFAIARPAARLPEVDSGAIGACLAARRAVLRSAGSALPDSSIDLQQITAALAGTVNISDLGATLLSAAASIGVDVIGLSTLDRGELREIAAAGSPIDRRNYLVRDFPATQAALVTGATIEAHLGDPLTDQAERILMQAQHLESVLITPLIRQGVPLGVLEFSHRSRKRWSTYEIKQARNLADHLTHVLFRLAAPNGGPGCGTSIPLVSSASQQPRLERRARRVSRPNRRRDRVR